MVNHFELKESPKSIITRLRPLKHAFFYSASEGEIQEEMKPEKMCKKMIFSCPNEMVKMFNDEAR